MKNVGIDAVRNDLPVRLEVAVERDGRAVRDGDGGAQHVEPLLEEAPSDRVAERPVEIRVERADDRTLRLLDREDGEDRRERRVHVHDVVLSLSKHAAHVASEIPAECDPRL